MKFIKTFEGYEEYDNDKGGRFWGNQGAGVLPICKKTGKILVAMRSDFVNEPNTWGTFGGKIDQPAPGEKKETPEEAAKRELQEESGHKGHFELIPAFVYKSPDKTFQYHNFIGLVDDEFKPKTDWETAYAEWMTFQELIELKDKHFGLESLLDNSFELIKKYAK